MIIDNIEIEFVKIKLTRPYTIAYKTTSSINNIFIKIILNNGIVGLGSSSVSKYVVGLDTKQSYENAINFKNELIGKNISYFLHNIDIIEKEFNNDPGSKAAYNIALYDAFCKSLNISLGSFLGRIIPELPTSITVGIKDINETIEEINEYYSSGFRYIKIKLGDKINYDIERIIKINEKFGSKIKIRIDANQGWSVDDTIRFFNEIKDVELIEQPISVDENNKLLDLPEKIKEIIALDESLVNYGNAIKYSQKNYGKIFNIKLMKCGGITSGRKIANIALLNNIDLMWGCNDESIISISAALNTALSFSNTKYLDLDGSLDLAKDLVSGGFNLKNGVMKPLDKPGLGVELI